MPAKPVTSEVQWEMLLQCMQEHPAMARGSSASEAPLAKKRIIDQWRALASRLNSVSCGTTKSPRKWREYWNNTKYNARKKASTWQYQAYQTEGEPTPKRLVLTERDEQTLRLIGRVIVRGEKEESVRIPFDVDEILSTIPSVSLQEPSVSPQKPSVSLQSPSVSAQNSSVTLQKPSVSPQKPSVSLQSPSVSVQKSSVILQKPSVSLQKPSVLMQKPSDSALPTLQSHKLFGAQAPPLLSNPHSSPPIDSPEPIAASSSSTSDIISEQTQRVAVVDSNMSRISFKDLNCIQNRLQQRLWDYMIDTSSASQPTFEYCSVLEPFGLIFKCCNLDAVDWLTNTIEDTIFAGHNLVVILDNLESKLPKSVNLCVNIITDYSHTTKNIESVFNVLVRTNQSWLNTPQWMLLHDKCVSVTSFNPSDGTALCVVFSVLLNDIRRLRERQFKLHFLFGVVPVDYYEESKVEIIQSQEVQ